MKRRVIPGLLLILGVLFARVSAAQNVAGFWLGVTYPSDPLFATYNYTMTLTQTGATLGGTAQTSNPNVPFGGVAYIKGAVNGTTVTFGESDKNGSTAVKDVCYWRGTMTYDPVNESLIGTYESIMNGTTCNSTAGGKVELYRIVLKSGTTYCKGAPIDLLVTGKDIRWYASASKTNVLARGNKYSPKLTKTTTFYITQTLYQNESPAVPITVEVTEPTLSITTLNTGCDKSNGSLAALASGTNAWQYSLNGGAFQTNPQFTSLKPGSYTVVAQDAAGCRAEQTASITADAAPTITNVVVTPPKCASANGEASVVATGGKSPLTYSIDYGGSYQSSPRFMNLAGGSYTLRTRDANGCETNRAVAIPAFKPMTVLSVAAVPTSCGQANGQATFTTAGGTKPVQYSVDNQTFQTKPVFVGLRAGEYTLTARDSAGCTVTESVSVAASSGPQPVSVQAMGEGCGLKNGAMSIATRAVGPEEYSIDGVAYQPTTLFSGLSGGTYTLTIRDGQNCTTTQAVRVPLDCANQIHLPTAFSPNRDMMNDGLRAYFAFPTLNVSRFTVYDRWGVVVYSRADFTLTTGETLWDGQLDGKTLMPGTYIYRLECQFPDGTQSTYRESVAILK